jgi:hypothetical protein
MDPEYTADLRELAVAFERFREDHGTGDPDAAPHRADDPVTASRMRPRFS